MKKWLTVLVVSLGLGAHAGTWHSIAQDDLGKAGAQPYLVESAGNWRFNLPHLSEELQTVAFGNALGLVYKGVLPTASYQLKLRFVCDAGNRKQSVVVNGETLVQPFLLKKGEPTDITVDIPHALASSGMLRVQIRKHAGDNAVLSFAELLSSERQEVEAQGLENGGVDYTVPIPTPRLSPLPTTVPGVPEPMQKLDGTWKFNPAPGAGFEKEKDAADWVDIRVPGEWAMQGFDVGKGTAAGYFRPFTVSKGWNGKRIKLRFDAVYSECTVYVNGQEVGSHLGGFTPFELDVTAHVEFGRENTLALAVENESLADSLASGSQYACHPLGGIPRSVFLLALPEVNISSLAVQTSFDSTFTDAELKVLLQVDNESGQDVSGLAVRYELAPWKGGQPVALHPGGSSIEGLPRGQRVGIELSVPVEAPEKWDCENPNLYVLTCTLLRDGTVLQTVRERFGFRTTEVAGNQLLVNGKPVMLRGVNRHEVYPLTGRSVPAGLHRRDVELFREGNANLLRTSHYPPDKALMEAADELGMFIECEGPYCWAHKTKADPQAIHEATVRQNLEMVEFFRNHPSIIYWSIANESHWNTHFEAAGKAMAELDPTRPLTFNYYPWGKRIETADQHVCAIASDHYPGFGGAEKYAEWDRPMNFGEFAHLNAYNRFELATDQGLRDRWGIYLHRMWEGMVASPGVAGGSIWAGIDDTFYWDFKNPDGSIEERTVGYGTWGPIDGWRRKKPEFWGMKKTYSPIRIDHEKIAFQGSEITVPVENRQDFSNLRRLGIHWKLGDESGTATADVPPRSHGELVIQTKGAVAPGSELELVVGDPRGFNVDSFRFPLGEAQACMDTVGDEKYTVSEDNGQIAVDGNQVSFIINRHTGLFENPAFRGPHLMILPLNGGGDTQMHGPTKTYEPDTEPCTGWKAESVEVRTENGLPVVVVKGAYTQAAGEFRYRFNADGTFTVEYDFQTLEKVNPRQLGVVFDLPKTCGTLKWNRKGHWTTYPEWHIARLEGTASADEGFESTSVGPRTKPEHEWRHDRLSVGCHDFASTKHNIIRASLTNRDGHGLEVRADADRHVRAWIDGDRIRLLVAHYSNAGHERFLRRLSKYDDQPLEKGGAVSGSAKLMLK